MKKLKYMLSKVSKQRKYVFKLLVTIVLFAVAVAKTTAQNINTPNNNGPMGTQVNTLTGNLFFPRHDLFIPARGVSIDISFYYNSFSFDQNMGFGNGWSFNYSMKYVADSAGNITVVQADEREDTYKIKSGNFVSPVGIFDVLSQYQPGKYLLKTRNGTSYFFDNSYHKRLTKITEPNGNFLSFGYTDTLLTTITNSAAQTIKLNYTGGNLSSIVDAITSPTRTYLYQYDGYSNLSQVTDPLGNKLKYKSLVNGPMSEVTDKNGNVANIIYFPDYTVSELISCNSRKSFSYDTTVNTTTVTDFVPTSENQVTSYTYKIYNEKAWLTQIKGNCCGYNMAFDFDSNGNLIKKTDANGNTYTYTYDGKGNLTSITDPLNRKKLYSYSPDYNQVTSYTDANGNVYTIVYDAKGNPVTFKEPGNKVSTAIYSADGDVVSWTDANGSTYKYAYDTYGNATRITSPLNTFVTKEYDARGNLLSSTDLRGNKYLVKNDLLDRLTTVTDPLNNILSLTYDAADNITSYADQNGNRRMYHYDASNRLSGDVDAEGNSREYTYDAVSNVTKIRDKLGNAASFNYDNLNRLSSVTDALGNIYTYSYDNNGNIVTVSFPNGQSITNTFNKVDKLISSSDAGGSLGSFDYDNNNNVTRYSNGVGATVSGSYDGSNRLTSLTDPLGNFKSFQYDNNNNLTSAKDRNGNAETFQYDALNRVISHKDKNGFVTVNQYDSGDNLTAAVDQNKNKTEYAYDQLNRLVSTKFANGTSVQYVYDNLGNVLSQKLTDGNTITFQYDKLNRLKSKTLPGNNLFKFDYDAKGRLIGATNNVSTVALGFDAIDRLVSETLNGHATSYSYNVAAKTQGILYPDGSHVTRNYDFRNRVTSIAKNKSMLAGYQYNNGNQLQQISYANGVNTNYTYDAASRLNSMYTSKPSVLNRTFSFDNEVNKSAILNTDIPQASELFTYDANQRLISYKQGVLNGNTIPSPIVQNSYSYDSVGNLVASNLNGLITTHSNNNLNQVGNTKNNNQDVTFTYDANGNLTYDGSFHKKYDAESRLLSDSANGTRLTYQYDALGRRFQKNNNGNIINYYYSGLGQIEQRDGNTDTLLNETINNGSFTPLAGTSKRMNYFYHQNELNSVEALTDTTGNLIERYRYDPYGKTTILDGANTSLATSKVGNRFGFTGQEYDKESGTYHFTYRNYSPATGRFNQRDPLGYADGMSLYQYVHNNPTNNVDILGLKDCDGAILITNKEWDEEVNRMAEDMRRRTRGYGISTDDETHASFFNLAKNLFDSKYHNDLEFTDADAETQKYRFRGKEYTRSEMNYYFEGMLFKSGGYDYLDLQVFVSGWKKIRYGLSPTPGVSDMYTLGYNETPDPGWGIYLNSLNPLSMMTSAPTLGEKFGLYSTKDHDSNKDPENLPKVPEEDNYYKYKLAIDADGNIFIKPFLKQRAKGDKRPIPPPKVPCPPNDNNGGKQTRKPKKPNILTIIKKIITEVLNSLDPNEIIGPKGVGEPKWVSINDQLPYTILYENSLAASAPAKTVRVTYPVDAKQNENSISLGSFGFNNLTFEVPPNTASYYQRLNTVDSLGVFVDVTAGLDVVKHEIFWQFQSIDPITLVPPTDPLKGFLRLRDTTDLTAGHGFVNFSIRPVSSAHTGDTMHATASIVFDLNETIPTNVARNTIDAVAPVSQLKTMPPTSPTKTITLSWAGADDVNGSGLQSYTLYMSANSGGYGILQGGITRTDTTITLADNATYSFFVLATDSAGNVETLRPGTQITVLISGGALPVTWLFFNADLRGKDGFLNWATASEINSKEFEIERSTDGRNFNKIGRVVATGFSVVQSKYSFTDKNVVALNVPIVYYRLKQIDKDGKYTYSNILALQLPSNSIAPIVQAYPNPFRQTLNLMIANVPVVGKDDHLEMLTLDGRIVYQRTIGKRLLNSTITLDDLPQLTPGMYIVKLKLNKQTLSFKVLKQ